MAPTDRPAPAKPTLLALTFAVAAISWLAPNIASAFCGAYVNGGDAEMFNNATQAVMMREDQTTVLSIQNDYQGPPKDFAIIIPTPEVLQKENVKTIDDEVFAKIDRLTAPRLVEYWEQDPCRGYGVGGSTGSGTTGAGSSSGSAATGTTTGGNVNVEAKFTVGEYDIVMLSSDESTALESWIRNHGYNIPQGAAPYLDPYIQQGSYFFVAKVDTKEVEFDENGRAVLSPLRFHYQSDQFKLPVRLGLINSKGKQDLIVHTLARQQRYEVANYPNVKIPTNLRVKDSVKKYFASFYKALFRETLRKNRKPDGTNPVVTEYSWNASKCDPCPGPTLDRSDYLTLGADVLYGSDDGGSGTSGLTCSQLATCVSQCDDGDSTCMQNCKDRASSTAKAELKALSDCAEANCKDADDRGKCLQNQCSTEWNACHNDSGSTTTTTSGGSTSGGSTGTSGTTTGTTTGTTRADIPTDWTITRLHARYDQHTLGKDLVFSKAPPISGGRGQPGRLTKGAKSAGRNNFQGRYIITHAWDGPVDCDNPNYGVWGGKHGSQPSTSSAPGPTTRKQSASKEVDLDEALADDESADNNNSDKDTGISAPDAADAAAAGGPDSEQGGCSVNGTAPHPTPAGILAALLGLLLLYPGSNPGQRRNGGNRRG